MKPIACICKVLLECQSKGYELRAKELRVYPTASCEEAMLQVAS